MNITFGICTNYEDHFRLQEVVNSIDRLGIPHYEIIVVGGDHNNIPHLTSSGTLNQILFRGWIPPKKNIIARTAHFDVLVVCHDYFLFDGDWYRAYQEFGDTWDVCSNPQYLMNGKRHFTDWVVWDDPLLPRYSSLDYNDWSKTKHQYISGGYFLVKRDFLRENPLNEHMLPGQPEDVEWSLRIRNKAIIKCNPYAIVRHNKKHRDCHEQVGDI